MTTSLESLYCQECSTTSDNSSISTIDIVVGGNHGQGKFGSVSKFILRDNDNDSYETFDDGR